MKFSVLISEILFTGVGFKRKKIHAQAKNKQTNKKTIAYECTQRLKAFYIVAEVLEKTLKSVLEEKNHPTILYLFAALFLGTGTVSCSKYILYCVS